MNRNDLMLALKGNPWLDAASRAAAWPLLQARYLADERAAQARGNGAFDPAYAWLRELRGAYAGRRCFVAATGPSLRMEDLELIRGEYSFGMNSCLLAWEQTAWRPDAYVIQDEYVYEKLAPLLNGPAGRELKEIWVSPSIAARFPLPAGSRVFPLHYLDHKMAHRRGYGTFRFSADCYSCVCDGYSVALSILQLACYMGFQEIYLLGCDCNYNQSRTHFAEYGHRDPKAAVMGEKMRQAHQAFRRFADRQGVRVVNCTRGGMLEAYPRMRLEDAVRRTGKEKP